jgi:MFS family permease
VHRERLVARGYSRHARFALYGVFFAIDESQSKAFIADLEPERRATAVGAYNFVTGLLYLPASLVAGALWTVDPRWAFGLATLLTLAAIGLFKRVQPASDVSRSLDTVPMGNRLKHTKGGT